MRQEDSFFGLYVLRNVFFLLPTFWHNSQSRFCRPLQYVVEIQAEACCLFEACGKLRLGSGVQICLRQTENVTKSWNNKIKQNKTIFPVHRQAKWSSCTPSLLFVVFEIDGTTTAKKIYPLLKVFVAQRESLTCSRGVVDSVPVDVRSLCLKPVRVVLEYHLSQCAPWAIKVAKHPVIICVNKIKGKWIILNLSPFPWNSELLRRAVVLCSFWRWEHSSLVMDWNKSTGEQMDGHWVIEVLSTSIVRIVLTFLYKFENFTVNLFWDCLEHSSTTHQVLKWKGKRSGESVNSALFKSITEKGQN